MDPFRLCLALGPVAVYVLLLGLLNLSRRPLLVSGTRDAAALGLGVAGFVIVGPMELFFPYAAATLFQASSVWILLLSFYALCLILVLLLLRPRLIVYNMSVEQLRPLLADLVGELDSEARWAGDSLSLPSLGVQLHIEGAPTMRNVALVSVGPKQNYIGWRRLELVLTPVLDQVEVARNPRGASLVGAALLIGAMLVMAIARNPEAVAKALFDMLRL